METFLIILLFAAVAVGFFVFAMWLAKVSRDHSRTSDISTSPHMQQRGIKCAAQQATEQSRRSDCNNNDLCSGNCGSCESTDKTN